MKTKHLFLLFLFSTSFFSSLKAETIRIAVAANVSYAIEELKKEFSKTHPETKVQVVLGSSGKLTAQIKHGAPYQLFMSADMRYPEMLFKEKMAVMEPVVYAEGTLAIFSVKREDLSKGLQLLKAQDIKRIAVANPKTAPYGIATEEALKNAGLYDEVKAKFIFGESISQTVSYVITAADIGLVASASLYSQNMLKYKKNVQWKEISPELYTPIKQGMVILKKGALSVEVRAFYNFILGREAQKILREFGYHTL